MIYVVIAIAGVLVLQFFLSKHPIAGLILPMSSIFGVIMAGMVIFASDGGGWGKPTNRLTLLIFLLLTAVSFLMYFIRRRNEYQQGYLYDEKAEKKENKGDSEG